MANETRLIVEQTGQTVIVQSGSGGTFADESRVFRNQAEQFAQSASDDADQTALDRIATGEDRAQTGLDAAATSEDRVQTNADANQTAADRAQTGLDRIATGQDRVATGEDRTQTGLDAQQTAADRLQTGLDAQSTAADVLFTAADALATAADRVATGMDAAETAADRIATAADRVQTGLDVVAAAESAAEAQASADRIDLGDFDAAVLATQANADQAEADRIQTGLDRAQTGLDVVATGSDRIEVNNIFNSILTTIAAEGQVVGTYAEAQEMLTFFPAGSVVAVIADETFGGRKTYYRVEDYVGNPSIIIDFVSGADSLGSIGGASITTDFITNTFSAFEPSGNEGGLFAVGFFLTRIGADSINLVGEPIDSDSPGILGDISMSGLNFDFHNGTQWVRLTGSTF